MHDRHPLLGIRHERGRRKGGRPLWIHVVGAEVGAEDGPKAVELGADGAGGLEAKGEKLAMGKGKLFGVGVGLALLCSGGVEEVSGCGLKQVGGLVDDGVGEVQCVVLAGQAQLEVGA